MMGLLRIFKYVRKRIIKLSLENQRLKLIYFPLINKFQSHTQSFQKISRIFGGNLKFLQLMTVLYAS